MSKSRITELDSLRGLAAIAVVICHMLFMRSQFQYVHALGFWGVAIFFVISGFVISLTIDHKSSISLFVINRLSRLYPAYWFSVILVSLIWLVMSKGDINWLKPLANLTMFQLWLGIEDMDETYWTLQTELCFYFLIILFILIKKVDKIFHLGGLLLILVIVFNFIRMLMPSSILDGIANYFPLLNTYGYFYTGICFYRIYKLNKIENLSKALLLSCIILNVFSLKYFGNVKFEHIHVSVYFMLILSCYVLFLLMIYKKATFLNTAFLNYFGKISYSLYITHFYITFCFIIPVLEARGVNWILIRLICLAIIFPLAHFVNHWIEVPVLHTVRNLLGKNKKF